MTKQFLFSYFYLYANNFTRVFISRKLGQIKSIDGDHQFLIRISLKQNYLYNNNKYRTIEPRVLFTFLFSPLTVFFLFYRFLNLQTISSYLGCDFSQEDEENQRVRLIEVEWTLGLSRTARKLARGYGRSTTPTLVNEHPYPESNPYRVSTKWYDVTHTRTVTVLYGTYTRARVHTHIYTHLLCHEIRLPTRWPDQILGLSSKIFSYIVASWPLIILKIRPC